MANRKLIQDLFAAHAGQVVGFFRRRMSREVEDDAWDMAQEVFMRLMRMSDPGRIRDFRAYVFAVANNLRKERYYKPGPRREWVRVSLERALEEEPPELSVELIADLREDQEALLEQLSRAVLQLSPAEQTLLAMYYRDGLSYRDIAQRRGLASKSAVEKSLKRALQHLRAQMDASQGERQ